MSDLKEVVSENFTRYAGNVILDRAICDVRDMLKPSARMLTYSQVHITKNIPSKPFVKSARVVGDCLGHYYTHGDSSCYGTYMRMAKPFAMRYPLEDCQGNCGTVTVTGDEAAARYTELRLSLLGYQLFKDIDKDTINEWYDNFDETDTFPKILPTKGFYNIVNGSTGIGVSLSASIPQFNIKDINNALINLINNQNYEIDILPDFATGGILINADEVKASLKTGSGFACKLRSVVEYDKKNNVFIVKELPYGVYTSTISEEIKKLLDTNPDCGIEGINDGSGKKPDYLIYINKRANPDKVLSLLYKETSLQSYFTINMTVLTDNGRIPKVLGLREMLLEHIQHEKIIYRNAFNFDIDKIQKRIHIINGLLICCANIEEVVHIIKQSTSITIANESLCKNFLLDEIQAKAVLDMKLSKLANLEIKKLENEKEALQQEYNKIYSILNNEELFNQQLINDWREVAEKFGDARRTQILNLSEINNEPIEEKQLSLVFTNTGAINISEVSTLYAQKRNGIGTKFKLDKNEFIVDSLIGKNTDTILFFTSDGKFYHKSLNDFPIEEKTYLSNSFDFKQNEQVRAATILSSTNSKENIIFITKNGLLKKSPLSEYNMKRNIGATALKLDEGDSIVSVLFTNNEKICIASKFGQLIEIETKDIRSIGRAARGVIGMKLNDNDEIINAQVVENDTKEIISISEDGFIKRLALSEISITSRGTKGKKIQNTNSLCTFVLTNTPSDVLISSTGTQIRIKYNEIPLLGLGAQGVRAIKLSENSKIINLEAIKI